MAAVADITTQQTPLASASGVLGSFGGGIDAIINHAVELAAGRAAEETARHFAPLVAEQARTIEALRGDIAVLREQLAWRAAASGQSERPGGGRDRSGDSTKDTSESAAGARQKRGWLTSSELADELGLPITYVRSNWRMLGGAPLHDHAKSSKRYDLAHARGVMEGRRQDPSGTVGPGQGGAAKTNAKHSARRGARVSKAAPGVTPAGNQRRAIKQLF